PAEPPPTQARTLSLHDALPIYLAVAPGMEGAAFGWVERARQLAFEHDPALPHAGIGHRHRRQERLGVGMIGRREHLGGGADLHRSEEHTSELQSQSNLVCRLLL